MSGADDHHHRLAVQSRQGDRLGSRPKTDDRRPHPAEVQETEIHLSSLQELEYLPGVDLAQDQANPGVTPVKRDQESRKPSLDQGLQGASDPDGSALSGAGRHLLRCVLHCQEDRLGTGDQPGSRIGQTGGAVGPGHEADAQLAFQPADLLGERRLGDPEAPRRAGEVPLARQHDQRPEVS